MAEILDPEEVRLRSADNKERRVVKASVTDLCALFTAAISILVICGWIFHNDLLVSVIPRFPAMALSTALAFLVASISVWQLRSHDEGVVTGAASMLFALIVIVIGLRSVVLYGVDAINHVPLKMFEPVHHAHLKWHWAPYNRMAPNVGLNFLLFGLAVCLADVHREGERWPSQAIVLIVMLDGLAGLMVHLWGMSQIYVLSPFMGIATHTAVLFIVLSIGFLYARPDRGVVGVLRSDNVAGRAARRLLPALLVVPVTLGCIALAAFQLNRSALPILAYFVVVLGIGVLAWLGWGNVLDLNSQTEIAASYERKVAELEREQIANALTVTEQRLSFAIEGSGIGTWHWNLEDGSISWSQICKDLLGMSSSKLLTPQTILDHAHPDDRVALQRAIDSAVERMKPYSLEYRTVWPDGTVHWVVAKGQAYVGSGGEPVRLEGTIQDIDERKRADAELQAAAERHRALVRNVLETVTEGKLRLCERADQLPPVLQKCGPAIAITPEDGLASLRRATRAASERLGFPDDRWQEIVTAASEAGMNTIVHGGGTGFGTVSTDGQKTVQIRVEDKGAGIRMENLPLVTLPRGHSPTETLGHGLMMIVQCADRFWLLTTPAGTVIVLEQDLEQPLPVWF